PLPPTTTFLGAELARIESKKPTPAGEGLDTTRYAMPAPTGKDEESVEAWQKAYESSLAQLEHQRLRSINGTILGGPLGANAWKIQNFSLENTVEKLDKEGEEVRKQVETVNRDRKRSQEKGGEVLTRMEKRWTELVSGNMQLEIGCMAMEHEVMMLHARHAELKARLQAA
ncbi:pre-mRNA-splicing factor SPF27, partial [Phenoliferia sp. Uapishka_3]